MSTGLKGQTPRGKSAIQNHTRGSSALQPRTTALTPGLDDPEEPLVEEQTAMTATRSAGHAACADGRELQYEVAAFVAALPSKQRAALMWRVNRNLGYAEIGANLRCSAGEARATVYEVLRSLRVHVGDRL
jgi:DNA-directed RNA polymerase specialized sigma24 family protein